MALSKPPPPTHDWSALTAQLERLNATAERMLPIAETIVERVLPVAETIAETITCFRTRPWRAYAVTAVSVALAVGVVSPQVAEVVRVVIAALVKGG